MLKQKFTDEYVDEEDEEDEVLVLAHQESDFTRFSPEEEDVDTRGSFQTREQVP